MPLVRPVYELWFHVEGRELHDGLEPDHTVTITHGDQLRAELEMSKRNMPGLTEVPMNAATVWAWAACARLHLTEAAYPEFSTEVLAEMQKAQPEVVPVDPPEAASSGSA